MRLYPALSAGVDAWIAALPEPTPSRPEAIRRLIEAGLKAQGALGSDVPLDQQISNQETAIAAMTEHSEPSPGADMAAMDKAMSENDHIDMQNRRTRRKNVKRE